MQLDGTVLAHWAKAQAHHAVPLPKHYEPRITNYEVRTTKIVSWRQKMSTDVITRLPRINEPAPDFEAKSTHGVIRLSDYIQKGKWVMLFSHPADFTPVCTTEFIEFARHAHDFESPNVQLIGVSIDSV